MSSLTTPHLFSGSSSETSPPERKAWNVIEVYGSDMEHSTAEFNTRDTTVNKLKTTKPTFVKNDEWRILLEDATENAGATTAPNSASIDEFNKTKQHLLSDPEFATRVTDLRNVIDVLSQGDNPSVENGFIYYDGEFRMYGLRSGFQDGQQQGDRTKWTIRAIRDQRGDDAGRIFFSDSTDIAERLEEFRKSSVLVKPSTEPIEGVLVRDFGADKSTTSFEESATTSLDIRSLFDRRDSGQVVKGQSNSGVTRWDIEEGFDHKELGFEGEHAFAVGKPKEASKGKRLSSQVLGEDPEDGYVEALAAAAQLLDAVPESAKGDCKFSYYTPSGYEATTGRRLDSMPSEAEWLVSLAKRRGGFAGQ